MFSHALFFCIVHQESAKLESDLHHLDEVIRSTSRLQEDLFLSTLLLH